jgi:hypothetical protein
VSGLGYPFTPVPRRARAARRERRISADDYDLIAFVYDRANPRDLARRRAIVRLTKEQIVEGIAFAGKWDTLYKRIRRLAETPEAWFSCRSEGDRHRGFAYAFDLYPDAPAGLSDLRPSKVEPARPTESEPQARERSEIPADDAGWAVRVSDGRQGGHLSEQAASLSDLARGAGPHGERDFGPPPSVPVRATQTDLENPSGEGTGEDLLGEGTREATEASRRRESATSDDVVLALIAESRAARNDRALELPTPPPPLEWPDTDGIASEKAILADLQALVDAGHARWVETDEPGNGAP